MRDVQDVQDHTMDNISESQILYTDTEWMNKDMKHRRELWSRSTLSRDVLNVTVTSFIFVFVCLFEQSSPAEQYTLYGLFHFFFPFPLCQGCYVFGPVCLFVRWHSTLKTFQQIPMKFGGNVSKEPQEQVNHFAVNLRIEVFKPLWEHISSFLLFFYFLHKTLWIAFVWDGVIQIHLNLNLHQGCTILWECLYNRRKCNHKIILYLLLDQTLHHSEFSVLGKLLWNCSSEDTNYSLLDVVTVQLH